MRKAALVSVLLCATALAKSGEKLAELWADHARWLVSRSQKEEARGALRRAREADPGHQELAALESEADALPDEAPPCAELEARRGRTRREAAKLCDKLAAESKDEGWMLAAAELDPAPARLSKLLALVKQGEGNVGRTIATGRILVRLRELDPDGAAKGRYDAIEAGLARSDVTLVKGAAHAMVGWLSLPRDFKPKGSWPVLVAVDGAGSDFLGAARRFAQGRGSRRLLVLAPCSFSNTNEIDKAKYSFYDDAAIEEGKKDRIEFDLAGLLALLQTLRERYGADGKIGITGFSGGGNLCYGMTARHPGQVLFAAPACANFAGMGFGRAPMV
ncbi:MAG: alpha/beta hydrolase-fold protein, partial [Planctomycetota bacterium]